MRHFELHHSYQMVYDPPKSILKGRTKPLRDAMKWAGRFFALTLGVGFFTSEFLRIRSLPPSLVNDLYLALLLLIGVLAGGWWWTTQKELNILCDWLDPKAYEPPDDSPIVVGITGVLALLIFSSRNPIAFGAIYAIYNVGNLLATLHLQREIATAIRTSRERLAMEGSSLADIYGQAVDAIEAYYIYRPHLIRIAATLLISLFGLAAAFGAKIRSINWLGVISYACYIIAVLALEIVLMSSWRLSMFRSLRSLKALHFEDLRNRNNSAHE